MTGYRASGSQYNREAVTENCIVAVGTLVKESPVSSKRRPQSILRIRCVNQHPIFHREGCKEVELVLPNLSRFLVGKCVTCRSSSYSIKMAMLLTGKPVSFANLVPNHLDVGFRQAYPLP